MSFEDAVSRDFDGAARQRIERVRELHSRSGESSGRPNRAHLIGACGTGMGSVLALLKAQGWWVSGSDKAFYPPMGDVVRSLADELHEGYAAAHLPEDLDLVVVGNSVVSTNPEVEELARRGVAYASMPEVLAALLLPEGVQSVVIAGTHGKTTTTSALATMLEHAGLLPGYFVGGVSASLHGSVRAPVDTSERDTLVDAPRYSVFEGDEYDCAFFAKYAKFHVYQPDILVVTSLEFDHADIYSSVEEIIDEFVRAIGRMPREGKVIICRDKMFAGSALERLSQRVSDELGREVLFYGDEGAAGVASAMIISRSASSQGQEIRCRVLGEEMTVRTPLSGEYNALNLLACATVGSLIGVSSEQIVSGLAQYGGARRRQEVRAQGGGITLIEDFAHHPTAVRVTLQGIRERFPSRRLVVAFEPRSNTSRRKVFWDSYIECFQEFAGSGDILAMIEVQEKSSYNKSGAPVEFMDVKELVAELSQQGVTARSLPTAPEMETFLRSEMKAGDVVVIMSNGDFGGIIAPLAGYVAGL